MTFDLGGGAFPDVLADLHRRGHLPRRLMVPLAGFLMDLAAHASSAGLTASYGERAGGTAPGSRPPPGCGLDRWQRAQRVLDGLTPDERELLRHLVLGREAARPGLAEWGRQHSGFGDAPRRRAFAVGQVRALAARIAAAYSRRA